MSEPARIADIASLDAIRNLRPAVDRDYWQPPDLEPDGIGTPPRVPPEYAAPLDQLDQDDAVVKARRWMDERPTPGLMLVGAVGRGKSAIAGAIALAHHAPYRASFWPVGALMRAMKAEFGRDSDRKTIRMKIDERPMLVLDDIGTEMDTDWQLAQLAEIVDHRYSHRLGLVVTTNLTPRALGDRVGERTLSRLQGMCDLIQVSGPDRRRA